MSTNQWAVLISLSLLAGPIAARADFDGRAGKGSSLRPNLSAPVPETKLVKVQPSDAAAKPADQDQDQDWEEQAIDDILHNGAPAVRRLTPQQRQILTRDTAITLKQMEDPAVQAPFKAQILQLLKDNLDAEVRAGTKTQEQEDKILAATPAQLDQNLKKTIQALKHVLDLLQTVK